MLQAAGSQDPPAKVSLDTHEVTAVKSFANISFYLPGYSLCTPCFSYSFPWHLFRTTFLFFFPPWHLLLAAVQAGPHATCPCQMGTGLNGPLVQAKRATSLQGPAVQTPRKSLSLEVRHLGNTSGLENVSNPWKKKVLDK